VGKNYTQYSNANIYEKNEDLIYENNYYNLDDSFIDDEEVLVFLFSEFNFLFIFL